MSFADLAVGGGGISPTTCSQTSLQCLRAIFLAVANLIFHPKQFCLIFSTTVLSGNGEQLIAIASSSFNLFFKEKLSVNK